MQSQADFATQSGPYAIDSPFRHSSTIRPNIDFTSHTEWGCIKQGQLYFVISNQAGELLQFAGFTFATNCNAAMLCIWMVRFPVCMQSRWEEMIKKTQLGPIIGVVIDRAQ